MEPKNHDHLLGAICGFVSATGKWLYDFGQIYDLHMSWVVPQNIKDAFFAGIVGTLAGLATTQLWKWCIKRIKRVFLKK
ncbi:MAG: hypothetical protein M0Q26_05935 [Chitinophagaceae bacterium]|nr:hypothetical protein [Chitinophagaceae bacterium]MDP1763423.1 hypothetical protein [Sediminibacterium sp.]